MITVVFEVTLKDGMREAYLNMASKLGEELSKQEGFISLERFKSLENENRLVSIQTWRDEEAIANWRNNEMHQKTMSVGYDKILEDYTLKVLKSLRTYGKFDRQQSPQNFK